MKTAPRKKPEELNISFKDQPVMANFTQAVRFGHAAEIAAFGARGDGKTIGALSSFVMHAKEHHAQGFELPVRVLGVRDSFANHKLTTIKTLEKPLWQNAWKIHDQGHMAYFVAGSPPQILVELNLIGIDDQQAKDKLKMEVHIIWFEEAAPSAYLGNAGIDEDSWLIAFTSARLPSHANPRVVTTNYPDVDHWTWQRFVVEKAEGTRYFRIPPGERASAQQRMEWERALRNRPDLQKRLLRGEPGVSLQGEPVAQGFNLDTHVSPTRLIPRYGDALGLGFDFGLCPSCIIGANAGHEIHIYASLFQEGAGVRQLMEDQVLPWLGHHAPWVLKDPINSALIGYDPAGETREQADSKYKPISVIKDLLDGWEEPGPVRWPERKETLLQSIHRIKLDPQHCQPLIKALSARWVYPKTHLGDYRSLQPKKPCPPWADLGDAFIYLLYRLGSGVYRSYEGEQTKVIMCDDYQPSDWRR
jgi:hypothetical protein